MSETPESLNLETFSGWAPLFPLPQISFFPKILLPLHIFEPRYRQMTADALAGERLIAMAQLRPGWEAETVAEPEIYEHVCLGRISAEEYLPDGRYFLVLQGLVRARVRAEKPPLQPYRIGRLELLPDELPETVVIDRERRRAELLEALRDLQPQVEIDRLLQEALDPQVSLGLICDVIASVLPLESGQVEELLQEPNVDLRSDLVLSLLRGFRRKRQSAANTRPFPPDFSMN